MAKKVAIVDDDVNTVTFLTAAMVENGYVYQYQRSRVLLCCCSKQTG